MRQIEWRHGHRLDSTLILLIHVFRGITIGGIVYGLFSLDWLFALSALGILLLLYASETIERLYGLRIPLELELWYVAFMFGSLFLGGLLDFYSMWTWDILMHFSSMAGITLGAYLIGYVWWQQSRLHVPLIVIPLSAFMFATTVGVVWEIFEFAADAWVGPYLDFQLQASNLDTMFDFVFNSLGAGLMCVVAYLHIKSGRARWPQSIIDRLYRENPSLK